MSIADSEGDIYELFAEPRGEINPVHFLIRMCQNRALLTDPEADSQAGLIRERVELAPLLFTNEITVRGRTPKVSCEDRGRRQARVTRKATVEVRATTMTLRPPYRAESRLPEVTVNVVLVRETDPPAGEVAVEWVLLTTLPIDTIEQVREAIGYYCVRWTIEVFFRVLKSGCRVEDRQFEELDRWLRCLSVYLIAAWRTLWLCRLSRSVPEMDCESVFEPSEWKSVWVAVKGEPLPASNPKLSEVMGLIAQLGGYVKRKTPPGVETIWRGLQRMQDLAWAWDAFGPGAKKDV